MLTMLLLPSNRFFVNIDLTSFILSIDNPTHLIEHHLHRLTTILVFNKAAMVHTYRPAAAHLLLQPV